MALRISFGRAAVAEPRSAVVSVLRSGQGCSTCTQTAAAVRSRRVLPRGPVPAHREGPEDGAPFGAIARVIRLVDLAERGCGGEDTNRPAAEGSVRSSEEARRFRGMRERMASGWTPRTSWSLCSACAGRGHVSVLLLTLSALAEPGPGWRLRHRQPSEGGARLGGVRLLLLRRRGESYGQTTVKRRSNDHGPGRRSDDQAHDLGPPVGVAGFEPTASSSRTPIRSPSGTVYCVPARQSACVMSSSAVERRLVLPGLLTFC